LNKKKLIVLLLTLLFAEGLSLYAKDKRLSFTKLDGQWELYVNKTPDQLFALKTKSKAADCMATVPGFWNTEVKLITGKDDPKVYGCYRYVVRELDPNQSYAFLIKDSPATSCAVYVNQELKAQNGYPFTEGYSKDKGVKSQVKPLYGEFTPDSKGRAEIIVFINNYFYRKSGLWDSVMLGPAKSMFNINSLYTVFYTFISGILLFICLLNLIQFLINRKRKEYLYLGIMSLVFALRVSTAGYCSLAMLIPALTTEIKIKLEYMVLWLVPVSMLQMLTTIYPVGDVSILFKSFKEKYFRYSLITITLLSGVLSLALPAVYANKLVPLLQGLTGVSCFYIMVIIVANIVNKQKHIVYYLFSCGVLITGGIIDTIYTKMRNFLPLSLFPFFLVIFIFIQIILLAAIQNDIYQDTRKITTELKQLNEAYLRFVPKEFLKLLNKASITNIQLGDHSSIEMTIMFSKMNFTDNGKTVLPEEHFYLFNEYLEKISPVIKEHNGFVSKFLSGGFMALFPESELDAVQTALEIIKCSEEINQQNSDKNNIIPRIGIHYGKMIIGTIGEENRLDDTVISDTVNTASRIESVCEKLDKKIIISHSLQERLGENHKENFRLNELESIAVKGKQKPLQLYEIVEK